ncbi:MAG: hypothetical protein WDM88_10200 [Galbitalea sp.]
MEAEPSLWPGLIGHLDDLPTTYRDDAYAQLETTRNRFTEDEQFAAWEALDKLARRHREHAETKWALAAEDRERLEEVAAGLRPAPASLSERWLFDDSMPDLGIKKASDRDNYEEELAGLRANAVRAIWSEGGLDVLLEVAQQIKEPWSFGYSFGATLDLSP